MDHWNKIDVVFVRHAESKNNCLYDLIRETHGDTLSDAAFEAEVYKLHDADPVLSPKGETQAKHLLDFINDDGLSSVVSQKQDWQVYSSPMRRCLITSKSISDALDLDVLVHPRLFESDGCFEKCRDGNDTIGLPGMTASEVESAYPRYKCLSGMETGWYKLPKKESRRQFLERSQEIVDWLWKLHTQTPEERGFATGVILSIHGNLIASVIAGLMKVPMLMAHSNTGITHIELWKDSSSGQCIPAIHFVNRIDHLLSTPGLVSGSDTMGDYWMHDFIAPLDD
mmetsp:Transcript_10975/g.17881  ORF Transcript_10975/g.17881 Transcript_10975/m.17881 type:complete len:283 (-) Transcript_10975:316-1164(-)